MKDIIESGKTALGIEFGSTKIKAVLIDENNNLIATSGHKLSLIHILDHQESQQEVQVQDQKMQVQVHQNQTILSLSVLHLSLIHI